MLPKVGMGTYNPDVNNYLDDFNGLDQDKKDEDGNDKVPSSNVVGKF
jgi:hypothetical protein